MLEFYLLSFHQYHVPLNRTGLKHSLWPIVWYLLRNKKEGSARKATVVLVGESSIVPCFSKRRCTQIVLVGESSIVPCFSKRRPLKKDGSIKQLSFLCSMSSRQVRNAIVRGFSEKITEHEAEQIVYLQSDPHTHTITKIKKQECNGDDVFDLAGQGSL